MDKKKHQDTVDNHNYRPRNIMSYYMPLLAEISVDVLLNRTRLKYCYCYYYFISTNFIETVKYK